LNIKLPPTLLDYVPKFASKLGLSCEIESRVIEIILKKSLTSDRDPNEVAATALYFASI
jgi:transcription initiation factor TFIIIB Brf1 subunit/transcription initiation factor TFIIB